MKIQDWIIIGAIIGILIYIPYQVGKKNTNCENEKYNNTKTEYQKWCEKNGGFYNEYSGLMENKCIRK